MDIHKPKPAHSWREFLTEIGTIICGILIALGLEQAVEQVHWSHEVEAERAALLDEAKENVSTAAYRMTEDPCITRRLAEIEEGFRRQSKGQTTGFGRAVTRPPTWTASTGSWEIAVSGQALAHMPHKEKLSFSDAFDSYKAFARLRTDENAIWRRLSLISHPDILAAGDWVELHQAYGEALGMNERMKTLTKYVIETANMGQRPGKFDRLDADRLKEFCIPLY
jgi:hypothetical protein